MEDLDELMYQAYLEWGEGTVEAIKKEIRRKGLRWRGTLEKSVEFKPNKNFKIEFGMEDYGYFLDAGVKGLRGGRSENNYQFRGQWKKMARAIEPWANSKGINPFAAAHSIQEKGLKPRKFFDSVIDKRLPMLEDAFNDAITGHMNDFIDEANASDE